MKKNEKKNDHHILDPQLHIDHKIITITILPWYYVNKLHYRINIKKIKLLPIPWLHSFTIYPIMSITQLELNTYKVKYQKVYTLTASPSPIFFLIFSIPWHQSYPIIQKKGLPN